MNADERAVLVLLDAAERDGRVLTGAERGRLADLRKAEILDEVRGLLREATQQEFPVKETR